MIWTLKVMLERLNVANENLKIADRAVLSTISDETQYETEYEKVLEYEDKVTTIMTRLVQRKKRIERKGISRDTPSASDRTGERQLQNNEDDNCGESFHAVLQPRTITSEYSRNKNIVKLPRIELKRFNGELENWTPFWEQFKTVVHENNELDNVTKFNYLQTVLTGKAAITIQGLTASEACYEDAIEMLKNEYGSSQKLIDNYIQRLMAINPVKGRNDINALRRLYNTASSITRSLKSLGVDANHYGMMTKSVILRSIPYKMKIDFFKQEGETNLDYEEQIDRLLKFIKLDVEAIELAENLAGKREENKDQRKFNAKNKEFTAAGLLTKIYECLFCKSKSHTTSECNDAKTIKQRKEILKRNGRCFKCTRANHNSKFCKTKNVVCNKCKGRHVTSMCDPDYKKSERSGLQNVKEQPEQQSTNLLTKNTIINNVFLQTACAYISNGKNEKFVRLIIDGGSQLTFIKESVSRQLNLKIVGNHKISVIPFGSSKRSPAKLCKRVSLTLISQYSPQPLELTAIEVPEICLDTMAIPRVNDPVVKNLNLADERIGNFNPIEGISLLIGADFYWKLVTGEHIRISSELTAINTKLGWTLHGPNPEKNTNKKDIANINIATVLRVETQNDNEVIDLEKFWNLETIGISKEEIGATEFTEEFLTKNIKFKEDRYEVILPWKDRTAKLHDNYEIANARVKTLTSRLINNGRLFEYDAAIREYMDKDCAELAQKEKDSLKTYYMPHKPVYRDDKTTTRVRVVFDASSHAPGLASLNDHLMPGDNLVPDLLLILMNFRVGNVALTADIEKAFLQIQIAEQERDAHSFLWYETPISNTCNLPALARYRMKRVTFGVTCSPFLLSATLRKHLTMQKGDYEGTCKRLLNSFYVDDLVIGVEKVENGKLLYEQAKMIMKSMGMNLRKWNTNNEQLRKYIYQKEQAETSSNTKVLGLTWHLLNDTISPDIVPIMQNKERNQIPTKRTVLSEISKIYDPLGLLGPFVIRAKILLQSIWKLKLDWDSSLPTEILKEWTTWCNDIDVLTEFSVPRVAIESYNSVVQLHVFSDASSKAYGVAAYLREETEDGNYKTRLLMAKNRVSPIKEDGEKELTLPKLELTACVCAARLQEYIKKNLAVKIQRVYLWTDSKIALCWIEGDLSKWKPYVANRVREIQKLTKNCVIKHCPGKENPADLLTRGERAETLVKSEFWISGPSWLTSQEENWPSNDEYKNSTNDFVSLMNVSNNSDFTMVSVFPIEKFETLGKILRVTAYILRFINNMKKRTNKVTGVLSVEEIESSELYWVKNIQKKFLHEEYQRLSKKIPIGSTSRILTLNPFMDEKQVIRLGGRLQETILPYETKHPIIIPNESPLAEKIIIEVHRKVHHGGVNVTLAKIRERFWIIRARQKIKTIIRKCITCKRLHGKSGNEVFAPLPKDRVTIVNPFQNTGVDFAGPLYVRDQDESRKKTYIMLLTCAVTRAIHLELVPDMTAESCIQAFRRFIARRGLPSTMYSDNAKTFKRTALEIFELNKLMATKPIQDFARQQRIKWRFIVERASWWGGFWERMVKIVKEALKATLGKSTLVQEELHTVLVEIEASVNSRPLTYIDEDPSNISILTPSHFLTGRNDSGLKVDLTKKEVDRNFILKQWKLRQQIVSKYWKKWSKEYLQQLRSAHHVQQQKPTVFKVGDVVLVNEENLPRLTWKMARVTEVYMGRDGKIRACQVILSDGIKLRRPIQLLSPLELAGENVENQVEQGSGSIP